MDKLLFYLMANDTTYFTWNNGALDATSVPTPVECPQNWKDLSIKWVRDTTYFGVFRSASDNDFVFVGNGANILNTLYLLGGGVEANCNLRIDVIGDMVATYSMLYACQVDFSQYKYSRFTATIKTLDGDLLRLLKAYGDTNYNIPLSYYKADGITPDPDWLLINMDGIDIYAQWQWVGPDVLNSLINIAIKTPNDLRWDEYCVIGLSYLQPTTQITQPKPSLSPTVLTTPITLGTTVIQNEFLTGHSLTGSSRPNIIGLTPFLYNNYLFYTIGADQKLNFEVSGGIIAFPFGATAPLNYCQLTVVGYTDTGTPLVISLYLVGFNNDPVNFGVVDKYLLGAQAIPADPANHAITLNGYSWLFTYPATEFTFKKGLVYDLCIFIHQDGQDTNHPCGIEIAINSIFVKVDGQVRYTPTTTQALRPHVIFDRLVGLLSTVEGNFGFPKVPVGQPYSGVSSFLSDPALLKSDNYDNTPYNTPITSGNALRMFGYEYPYALAPDYPINTCYMTWSLNQFFNTMFTLYGVGMAIEGDVLRMEKLSYFFDNANMILDLTTFGDVVNLTFETINTWMGNSLNAGYAKETMNLSAPIYTAVLNEWNEQQLFALPFTRILKELNWTCPIKASVYAIEIARTNGSSSAQTDSSADNENYLIEIDDTTTVVDFVNNNMPTDPNTGAANRNLHPQAYNILRYPTSTGRSVNNGVVDPHSLYSYGTSPFINGVVDPHSLYNSGTSVPFINGVVDPHSLYNYGLSPHRNVLRNGALIRSACFFLHDASLQFNTYSKMALVQMESNLSAVGRIGEYEDIPVNNLAPALFQPILVTFDSPTPVNMNDLMNGNTKGYVQFSWLGNIYKGFVWEVGLKPGSNDTYSFKLALTPDCDTSKLSVQWPI